MEFPICLRQRARTDCSKNYILFMVVDSNSIVSVLEKRFDGNVEKPYCDKNRFLLHMLFAVNYIRGFWCETIYLFSILKITYWIKSKNV